MTTFSNTREIEARISELEGIQEIVDEAHEDYLELTRLPGSTKEAIDAAHETFQRESEFFDAEELRELIDFKTDIESYCDWYGGETLIPEKARVSYAKQLAEDCDNIPRRWPFNHIDWHTAADDLFHSDYHSADLNGSTFYVRMN